MDAVAVAREVAELPDSASLAQPFTSRDPSFDIEAAYAASRELLRRREQAGARRVGRKIGFTNRTIWDQYAVYEPIFGYMYDRTVAYAIDGAGSLSLDDLSQPLIEPEIVFRLRAAPPVTDDAFTLLQAVDWVGHGFEVVQCHFPGWTFGVADTVADGGLHGRYLVGGGFEVSDAKRHELVDQLASFRIDLLRDGVMAASGGGALVLESPLNALVYLVRTLAALPDHPPLAGGELVTTGTLTTALPVERGQTWETQIEGLPVPGLQVRFL